MQITIPRQLLLNSFFYHVYPFWVGLVWNGTEQNIRGQSTGCRWIIQRPIYTHTTHLPAFLYNCISFLVSICVTFSSRFCCVYRAPTAIDSRVTWLAGISPSKWDGHKYIKYIWAKSRLTLADDMLPCSTDAQLVECKKKKSHPKGVFRLLHYAKIGAN